MRLFMGAQWTVPIRACGNALARQILLRPLPRTAQQITAKESFANADAGSFLARRGLKMSFASPIAAAWQDRPAALPFFATVRASIATVPTASKTASR